MAYFEPYIDADGIHIPTYNDILDYLQEKYRAIFGDDVYLGEETPDYQLLSVFAKCIDDYSALATQAYNDRNPNYAVGDALDTLVQMSGITRKLPTASTVILTISGQEGTVITDGQVIDSQGNIWLLDEEYTIPEGGSGTVGATCETLGAIVAPVGTIEGIYTPVPGWDSVTNESPADIGLNMETDAELRARFSNAHSMEENGTISALVTGILNLVGVKFVSVVHNDTSTDYSGSGGLHPHSFCAVVDGGEEEDIAAKILQLKSPGVGTDGTTTQTVVDSYGNSNTIKFSRPVTTTVNITVTITDLGGYDSGRVNPMIEQALKNDIDNLGIGKSWTLTMGYKDIYSAFDDGDMPIAVTNITSSQASDGIVPCAYDHVLHVGTVTITTGGG